MTRRAPSSAAIMWRSSALRAMQAGALHGLRMELALEAATQLTCVALIARVAQGCIGQAMVAAYLWRVGQPVLLSAGPAPQHGAAADAQLALLWMILVPPEQ